MHARMRDKSCAHVILDTQLHSNLFGHVGSTCGELSDEEVAVSETNVSPAPVTVHSVVVGQVTDQQNQERR